jgi:hypothetical protein
MIIVSCNKNKDDDNNNPTGPLETHVTDGFLATIGVGRTGTGDTLVYRHNSGVAEEFEGYVKGSLNNNEQVRLGVHGNSIYSIERKTPYMTGGNSYIYFSSSDKMIPSDGFPGYDYRYRLIKDYTPAAEFNIVWQGDKFSIESRLHPGLYFCPAKWAYATHPTQSCLVLGPNKYFFFFLKN